MLLSSARAIPETPAASATATTMLFIIETLLFMTAPCSGWLTRRRSSIDELVACDHLAPAGLPLRFVSGMSRCSCNRAVAACRLPDGERLSASVFGHRHVTCNVSPYNCHWRTTRDVHNPEVPDRHSDPVLGHHREKTMYMWTAANRRERCISL